MDGIELALRFSYIVNKLRYCGPKGASEAFLEYLKKKDVKEDMEILLSKFEGMHPYFSVIAAKHGLDWLDKRVVEAYWIGNNLLDNFSTDDLSAIIEGLESKGLPSSLGNALVDGLKPGMVPHHSFNVFYVGVGKLTSSVETTLPNMETCRISWGRVLDIKDETLMVRYKPVKFMRDEYILSTEEEKEVTYLKEMLPDVKVGDFVAIHWNFACLVLDDIQLHNLERFTKMTLKSVQKE